MLWPEFFRLSIVYDRTYAVVYINEVELFRAEIKRKFGIGERERNDTCKQNLKLKYLCVGTTTF